MKAFEELGREVAEAQDAQLEARTDLGRVRSRLLAPAGRRSSRAPRWVGGLGLGLAALAGLGLFLLRGHGGDPEKLGEKPPAQALRFTVGGQDGQVGRFIAPDAEGPVDIAFSDGSRIDLARASSARVTELHRNGARVLLERGEAEVTVEHLPNARWELNVGPFDVHVIGTEFHVAWDPSEQYFELRLIEGRVRIEGPSLQERVVERGELVRVWVREGREETRAPGGGEPGIDTAPSTDRETPEPLDDTPLRASDEAPRESAWRTLIRAGEYDRAFALLEGPRLTRALRRASAADLLALADAARYSGRPDQAVRVYEHVRQRFPGTERAASAAFYLGRIEFDSQHRFGAAANHFEAYLRERPRGRFAREAAGRLVEARRRAGDRAGARRAAEGYLQRFPEGPHARLARRILATPR